MALPDETSRVGSIEIVLHMGTDGLQVSYDTEGVTKDAAIGYLTTVLDRIREERKYEWATCPECKKPWASHYELSDEDEDY